MEVAFEDAQIKNSSNRDDTGNPMKVKHDPYFSEEGNKPKDIPWIHNQFRVTVSVSTDLS